MIELVFTGRIKNRKIYEEFAHNIIDELFPREFKRDIIVGISFKTLVGDGVYGQATCHNKEDESDVEYHLVEVAKVVVQDGQIVPCTAQEIASTLVHELVHIRQYIRRELDAGLTRWKGQVIPYGPRGGLKIPYKRQPWEIEAFSMEREIMEYLWVH